MVDNPNEDFMTSFIQQLIDLGYDVQNNDSILSISGFGMRGQLYENDQENLQNLVDPSKHVERKFQFEHPDAAAVRMNLTNTGHKVTRPDPTVDVFDISGPMINKTGVDIAGLLQSEVDVDLANLRDQKRTIVLALLARTDQWIIRATEDGVTVLPLRKQRRVQLRNILASIDTATVDQLNNLQLPDINI